MKEQIKHVRDTQNFLQGDYADEMEQRALGFRDFYEAQESSGDEGEDGSEISADSDAQSEDSWDYIRKKRKHTKQDKKGLYETQIRRAMGVQDASAKK